MFANVLLDLSMFANVYCVCQCFAGFVCPKLSITALGVVLE